MRKRFNETVASATKALALSYNIAKRYRTTIACIVTAFLFSISFLITPSRDTVEHDAAKLERKIYHRQDVLEEYVEQALATPVDKWLDLEDFPDDMVIYKYNADTLQSWVNQFPIHNDDVDVLPLWHRLNYLNSRSLYSTPLDRI